MKANRGTVWINAGLLLIAAALFLSAYNERESHEARDSARQVIAQLCDALPTEAGDDEAEPTTLPESLPDVQREMPVKTINGRDYIGVLSIPSLELELPVIESRDSAGYVLTVRLGDETLTGEAFRFRYELNSSCFTAEETDQGVRIVTRGLGHGFGMSLYTAGRMALEGRTYREILSYFYKNLDCISFTENGYARDST